ncbi:helix-turn-helix domain-containing protein [Streptomyces acidiscabies]|uniref:helix-turn-helix domain-containing protein n=1 Tax=Streptomyces acidiscabies TaxID=42234 RepID=UPI0015BE9C45|nr:helix-turn-helix transcriptional regulator [Streptomyces acidiscabies]
MRTDSTPMRSPSPLRAVRTARGLGLRTVAALAGIDPGHLSKVERGEKQLSLDSLYRLATVLGLQELAGFLRPYLLERDAAAVLDVRPKAATENDEATRVPAGSPQSSKSALTSK